MALNHRARPLGRCGTSAFCNVDKSILLYVPSGSIEAYLAAAEWQDFTNIQTIETHTSTPAVYTNPANTTQKLIHEGNVDILRGDKTYTMQGQEVK